MLNLFRISLLALLCSGSLAFAEETSHGGGHHGHKNVVSGFIGITGQERRERALTLGVEYNRWVTPKFGIGIGIERALGDLDFTVIAVPFSYRINSWKLFAGPGWESSEIGSGRHFLARLGAEYIIQKEGYEIAPKIMFDIIDGDVVVVGGVAIGLGF